MEIPEGFKKTEVGVIPVDWEVKKLGEIALLERGKFSARPRNDPKYFGGDIPFIQTGDVTKSNGIISTYYQSLNEQGLRVSKLFPPNTLFFTIAANIGDVGIAPFETACPDSLIAITPGMKVDKKWFFHILKSRKKSFEGLATQNAQLNINLEKLQPYLLQLPSLPEQKAIALSLSDTDALIAACDRAITKKRNIKQGAMQQLLTGKMRLPGFSGEWEVKKLENLSSEIGDGIHATPDYVDSSDFYFINGNNLIRNSIQITDNTKCISKEEYYKYKNKLNDKTILLSINGTIGNIAFFRDEKVILGKSVAYINIHIFTYKYYIFYVLQTHTTSCYFEDELTGSTIRNLSLKSIRNTPVSIPPTLEEQKAIAQILSDMDAEIAALEKKRDKYKCIKQGMMQELLTGKTRLKINDDTT